MNRVRSTAVFAALTLLTTTLARASDAGSSSGEIGPSLSTTANGRALTPAGRMTVLGDFPSGGALSPDGRFYWAVDSGHGQDDVQVVDVANGQVSQTLPLPGAYGGIAFAPDGRTVYVSGEPVGNSHPAGPTVATNGDAIHVFKVDPATGHAAEAAPITLPPTKGGKAQMENANPASIIIQPPVPGPSSGPGWPLGLAVTSDNHFLVVALNQADQIAIVNLTAPSQPNSTAISLVKVGTYPYGVAVNGHTAYVSNEYDGTISQVDIDAAKTTRTITVGSTNSHPEGLALDRDTHRLYAAVTNRDEVAVVDTSTGTALAPISVGRDVGIGTAPVAVAIAPLSKTLYVADAGEDAVAVISLQYQPNHLIGRIPTAAYTSDVAVTPGGGQLIWLAAKGLGAGPNPLYGQHFAASESAPYGQYVPDMLRGRLGVLATPNAADLIGLTRAADIQVTPADLSPGPANSPVPDTPVSGPGGGPSRQIKHVFYVVKENRTYDQIFGSDPRGDGDPALELFDDNGVPGPAGGVTPNAHRLTHMFPLLDHVYADSEVSVDGHLITSGSYATDFVQKALHANYAGRGRVLNAGQDPVTFPPNDFLFDQATRQGVPFVNDGEISGGVLPSSDDGRSTYLSDIAHTAWGYPLFFGCDNAGLIPVTATNHDVACSTDSGTLGSGPNRLGAVLHAATSRIDFFQQQLNAELATGTVPTLTYLTLPNDHTNGATKNYPTPRAMVADNDLGLGQLVDVISHSPIWSSSAIFVVEDDSQDGADHVDAHRMPAYVISPWAKHGAVVHTRYDQLSVLRTVELITGLRPLSMFDALAEPMYDAFIPGDARPDLTPYNATLPTQRLDQITLVTPAGIDGALPYQNVDLVPQRLFDAALWRSVYGPNAPPPPPGPDASPREEQRARRALQAWQQHHSLATSPNATSGETD